MRVLVLHAHPDPASATSTLFQRVCDTLADSGHDVDPVDLYDLDGRPFAPALTPDERRAYHGPDPVVDPVVADQIERLRSARALVFCYPTWWFGPPAVLKGWFDRVLVPGVGFRFDERGRVRPGLTHIRRLAAITVHDRGRVVTTLAGDGGRLTIARRIRATCGWRTRLDWLALYRGDRPCGERQRRFADRVAGRLARW